MATPEQWLAKLAKLKVDRANGDPAPHKPLLLLVVLELAEQGLLPHQELPLTPELAFRFNTYWSMFASRRKQRPDIRFPFFHLKSDGFWSPLGPGGKPATDRRDARFAKMPSDFLNCAKDPAWRDQARRILIAAYFPPAERAGLYALTGLPVPTDDQIAKDAGYKSPDDAQKQGREGRFRIRVVDAYGYTCALTRYRLTTLTGKSIVDAAHIHAKKGSGTVVRSTLRAVPATVPDPFFGCGLALCKNAHWLFDKGLWTLTSKRGQAPNGT
jgi:putative restriction endonuclease